jgi:hypothetical protein
MHWDVGICLRVCVHVQLPAGDCELAQWMAMDGNVTLTVCIDTGASTSTMADGIFGLAFFAATCHFNRNSRAVLTTMVFVEDS